MAWTPGVPEADGRILAVIPAYQEAPRVADVVRGVQEYLPVLVVDDGSTDGTAEAVEATGAEVVRQRPNRGKGAALRTGFLLALERDREAVVTLDADGQHVPAEIPRLVSAYAVGEAAGGPADRPALVVGRRDFSKMPLVRRLSNSIGRLVLSAAVGRDIPDNQSGYRLVDRRLMTAMLASREPGFAFEVEMIARCVAAGWPIAWVPISTIYAGEPSHIRPVEHVRSFLRAALTARRVVRDARQT